MNISVVQSSYPAPIAPDFHDCDTYYEYPNRATYEDCQVAFDLLPAPDKTVYWDTVYDESDPYSLPFVVTHGM